MERNTVQQLIDKLLTMRDNDEQWQSQYPADSALYAYYRGRASRCMDAIELLKEVIE